MKAIGCILAGMMLMLSGIAAVAQGAPGKEVDIDIESQALTEALNDWAKQTQLQFIGPSTEVTDQIVTPRVKGRLTPEEALALLLVETPLTYEFLDQRLVSIQARQQPDSSESDPSAATLQHLANVSSASADTARTASATRAGRMENVLVVGTHIRGVQNNAAPVFLITRDEIDQSGFATIEQLMQSIPQNFGGGVSATTLGGPFRTGGEDAGQNIGFGSGINLRGLGNDSTLVLLNGRRLAPAGFGYAVDVSMIPLDAVERIEVLADGASAVYGSDAVGGVVNILLRNNFDGAQTAARYGAVTSGDHSDVQVSQLFGDQWVSGSALLSYYYQDQTALDARDRSATRTMRERTDLLGAENRHTVLLSASQDVADAVTLFGDAIYSTRDTNLQSNFGTAVQFHADATNYGATGGVTANFARSWQSELAVSYNRTDTTLDSFFPADQTRRSLHTQANIAVLDAKADGQAFDLPGGAAKLAVGAQVRRETYNSDGTDQTTLGTKRRNVRVGYAELLVPVIGDGDGDGGGVRQRLEVTLAGRYEHYDDFGSATNPKLGIFWSPAPGLDFKATAGRSFRAPLLFELDEHSFSSMPVLNLTDPASTSGSTPTIVRLGNNANLDAEKSRNWTAGVDLSPALLAGLDLSLTYFEADYKDRIGTPVPADAVFSVLVDESLYAAAITRNPSIDLVNQLFASPDLANIAGVAPAEIRAIVENRLRNISRRRHSGLDFDARYQANTRFGDLSGRISATYLLETREQLTPTAPMADLVNAVYSPVDLRVRGRLGWTKDHLEVSGWVSYVDGYKDRRMVAPREGPAVRPSVASWTTFDLNVAYDSGRRGDAWLLDGLRIALSAQNIFDRDPPFVAGPFGLNFDTANANALGRLVSIQVRKTW